MRPSHAGTPLGDQLRQYRTDAGLTQEELAERAGLSVRALSDIERGISRAPYRATLDRLASALDLDAGRRAILDRARQGPEGRDRKSTRLNFSHIPLSRMP